MRRAAISEAQASVTQPTGRLMEDGERMRVPRHSVNWSLSLALSSWRSLTVAGRSLTWAKPALISVREVVSSESWVSAEGGVVGVWSEVVFMFGITIYDLRFGFGLFGFCVR